MRNDNVSTLVFVPLNINSTRNKFDLLNDQIKGNIDILMVSKTKNDGTFPHSQFFLSRFQYVA